MKLDDLDKNILSVLLDDSRLSYRQIAKKTGVSVATIMNRVNSLSKEGIIKKYTALLDYEKLGYDVEVMIEVRIAKGKLIEVEKQIATNPSVFAVYDMTGDFDAVILARFPNRRKMDSFLKKIQTLDFVERTNTRIILNIIKEKQVGII
ncbi:Lrp/AsnC family transcriptional regulator [Candidatus Woesearchaeota archaeon]|nr:Lrp/AsnC family transcriptional regulator [Candidatus Woesearchaeota archaeon]